MAGSRGGSGSGSGSSSRDDAAVGDIRAPASTAVVDPIYIGDKTRNSTGDTCGYYKQPEGAACRQPRSCYDCLNTKLAGVPDGCVLSPGGACQAMGAYVAARDYRANHNDTPLSMAYYNYFPNTNTTYCEPTDAACERCRNVAIVDVATTAAATQITLGQWNGSLEVAQRFCVGASGCVCLAACATEKWKNNVQEDCSPGGSNSTSITDTPSDTYRSMLPIFMVLQFVLILMVIHRQRMYTSRFRRARPTQMEGPYNNPRAISSPSHRLELTGWRAMQQELVNREKAQRGLVSLMTPRDNNTIPPQPQPLDEPHPGTPNAQPTPPHNYIIYAPDDDDDIPELPPGTPSTPTIMTRRRGSTDASVAMLEDGRSSEPIIARRPTVAGITEEREARSQ